MDEDAQNFKWVDNERIPDPNPIDRRMRGEFCADVKYVPFQASRAAGPIVVICTRAKNHTRRHAAGNGDIIVAVWS